MGLKERKGQSADKSHGERRKTVGSNKILQKRVIENRGIVQQTKPLLFMRMPEGNPLEELIDGYIKPFAQLFNRVKTGKVLRKNAKDKKETVCGIGNDNIRKDSVCMLTAVTEYPEDTQTVFVLSAAHKVDDGTVIVVVDMTVTGASTDGTGFQMWLKKSHVGIKNKF